MIERLFAIPVYRNNLKLVNEFKFVKKQKFKTLNKQSGGGYQSEDTYILNKKFLSKLKKAIEKESLNYIHDYLKINKKHKFKMLNSWCIKHVKNDFSQQHYHHNSFVSGIVYLNCSPNTGNLNFHKPFGWNNFNDFVSFDFDSVNLDTCKVYTVAPEIGDIFLFPSSLIHSVTPNLTDIERYCISFNFIQQVNLALT